MSRSLRKEKNRERLIEYVLEEAKIDPEFLESISQYIPFDQPNRYIGDNKEDFLQGKIKGLKVKENGEFVGHILYDFNGEEFHWLSCHGRSNTGFPLSPKIFEMVKTYAFKNLGAKYITAATIRKPLIHFLTQQGAHISEVFLTILPDEQ